MSSAGSDRRDRELRRVNRMTGIALGAGLALTGGLASIAAHTYSGSAKPATALDDGQGSATVPSTAGDPALDTSATAVSGSGAAPDGTRPSVGDDQREDGERSGQPQERTDDGGEDEDEGEDGSPQGGNPLPSADVPVTVANRGSVVNVPGRTSTTTRPATVVTKPKRTPVTKPPVSGGS